jgi:CspA family cold shock protein
MARSKVKWFDAEKDFGFIQQGSGAAALVHFSAIGSDKSLEQKTTGEFEVVDRKKSPQATNVVVV